MTSNEKEGRESIWSIPYGREGFYFALFAFLAVLLGIYIGWLVGTEDAIKWDSKVAEAIRYLGPGLIVCAAIGLVVAQGREQVMLFNRERRLKLEEAEAALREEGRQAAIAELRRALVNLEAIEDITPALRERLEADLLRKSIAS